MLHRYRGMLNFRQRRPGSTGLFGWLHTGGVTIGGDRSARNAATSGDDSRSRDSPYNITSIEIAANLGGSRLGKV